MVAASRGKAAGPGHHQHTGAYASLPFFCTLDDGAASKVLHSLAHILETDVYDFEDAGHRKYIWLAKEAVRLLPYVTRSEEPTRTRKRPCPDEARLGELRAKSSSSVCALLDELENKATAFVNFKLPEEGEEELAGESARAGNSGAAGIGGSSGGVVAPAAAGAAAASSMAEHAALLCIPDRLPISHANGGFQGFFRARWFMERSCFSKTRGLGGRVDLSRVIERCDGELTSPAQGCRGGVLGSCRRGQGCRHGDVCEQGRTLAQRVKTWRRRIDAARPCKAKKAATDVGSDDDQEQLAHGEGGEQDREQQKQASQGQATAENWALAAATVMHPTQQREGSEGEVDAAAATTQPAARGTKRRAGVAALPRLSAHFEFEATGDRDQLLKSQKPRKDNGQAKEVAATKQAMGGNGSSSAQPTSDTAPVGTPSPPGIRRVRRKQHVDEHPGYHALVSRFGAFSQPGVLAERDQPVARPAGQMGRSAVGTGGEVGAPGSEACVGVESGPGLEDVGMEGAEAPLGPGAPEGLAAPSEPAMEAGEDQAAHAVGLGGVGVDAAVAPQGNLVGSSLQTGVVKVELVGSEDAGTLNTRHARPSMGPADGAEGPRLRGAAGQAPEALASLAASGELWLQGAAGQASEDLAALAASAGPRLQGAAGRASEAPAVPAASERPRQQGAVGQAPEAPAVPVASETSQLQGAVGRALGDPAAMAPSEGPRLPGAAGRASEDPPAASEGSGQEASLLPSLDGAVTRLGGCLALGPEARVLLAVLAASAGDLRVLSGSDAAAESALVLALDCDVALATEGLGGLLRLVELREGGGGEARGLLWGLTIAVLKTDPALGWQRVQLLRACAAAVVAAVDGHQEPAAALPACTSSVVWGAMKGLDWGSDEEETQGVEELLMSVYAALLGTPERPLGASLFVRELALCLHAQGWQERQGSDGAANILLRAPLAVLGTSLTDLPALVPKVASARSASESGLVGRSVHKACLSVLRQQSQALGGSLYDGADRDVIVIFQVLAELRGEAAAKAETAAVLARVHMLVQQAQQGAAAPPMGSADRNLVIALAVTGLTDWCTADSKGGVQDALLGYKQLLGL